MSSAETATQALHRLTSYEPGREWTDTADDPRIVQDLEPNDLERFPWQYKRYGQELPIRSLPTDLPQATARALPTLAGSAHPPAAELDLDQLARLLFLSAGVVRTAERHGRHFLFRAAGSAGARFPLEVYVAAPGGGELPPGVHWYDPERHALVEVGPAPVGDNPAVVVTGVPWRTGWRYRERGYRHLYWDCGTMLSQLLALAESAGIPARLVTRFPDTELDALVGADGVHEFTLVVVSLGAGGVEMSPGGPAIAGAVDRSPLEFPLATDAQAAGRLEEWGEPWPAGRPVEAPEAGPTVDEVVLRRTSQRRMDAARSLPRSVLETSMAVAMRGVEIPHWVAVHAVDGVEPGIYRWPELTRPVRAGVLRDELYTVALEQGLARDAAFVVISATRVADLDDRGYREAQLAAGLVEGRLHLAAYAQGASASGMTFLDAAIPDLLGEQVEALLFTCVGVPEYKAKPAGKPGSPAAFRMVTPRLSENE